ncbi:MAG: phage Gp37/Gp68 family protein [Methanosarcinaceae archaeon]|nr:phage Gp37/Gp68 family protein [Methanosarcinaceae archaeon]
MGAISTIEWTNATWNPVTGCSSISEGCANCYARRMAKRLEAMGLVRYRNGFRVTVHPDLLDAPLNWRKPRLIFVNSMSDLFHEDVPFDFIAQVFSTISLASCHVFQILTKRADRLAEVVGELRWPANLWVGVTVESQEYVHRINKLSSVPSIVRFVSFEPLLGPIKYLDLSSVDWAIVGGESGPHSRKMDPDWARMIRDACLEQSIPFFFKQWGGTKKSGHNRILDGKTWDQYPQDAMA